MHLTKQNEVRVGKADMGLLIFDKDDNIGLG